MCHKIEMEFSGKTCPGVKILTERTFSEKHSLRSCSKNNYSCTFDNLPLEGNSYA